MKFTFTIPFVLPGLNELIAAAKSGHGAGNRYSRLKADSELLVSISIKKAKVPRFNGPVTINFQWFAPNKRRDPDNISTGKKIVLDALQKTNIIKTDGWKYIKGLSETFHIDKITPKIIVTIESVEEDLLHS